MRMKPFPSELMPQGGCGSNGDAAATAAANSSAHAYRRARIHAGAIHRVTLSLSAESAPREGRGECYQAAMNEVLTTPNKRSRLSALVPRRAVAKMAHGLQRRCQVGVAAVEKLSNVSVGRGASFFCSVSSNREWFEEASKKFRSFSRFFTFFRLAVDKPNEAEALDDPRETF